MISASVHDTYHAKICLASEKSIFAKLRLIGSTNKYKHVTKYLDFATHSRILYSLGKIFVQISCIQDGTAFAIPS